MSFGNEKTNGTEGLSRYLIITFRDFNLIQTRISPALSYEFSSNTLNTRCYYKLTYIYTFLGFMFCYTPIVTAVRFALTNNPLI